MKMGENDIIISKNQVRKAGENVKDDKATSEDYKTISLWRSKHISIMTAMVNAINRKLKVNNLKAIIVARRLKRFSSIEFKLKRFPNMKFDTMQDIAGVRVVFKELQQVKNFQMLMEKTYSKEDKKIKFKLISTKDYIQKPKDDGYRSIHQIFEHKDAKMHLELQIRTQLQHYWATAVEVLGMKGESKIKQGKGEDYHKEFFKLSSALFSYTENTTISSKYKSLSKKDICKKIAELNQKHNILKNLSGLAVSGQNIENQANEKNYYFIVVLNFITNTLRITGFKERDFIEAKKFYEFCEQDSKENQNTDVVLISLDKFKLLKQAYPNYYLDSGSFIRAIKKELQELDI